MHWSIVFVLTACLESHVMLKGNNKKERRKGESVGRLCNCEASFLCSHPLLRPRYQSFCRFVVRASFVRVTLPSLSTHSSLPSVSVCSVLRSPMPPLKREAETLLCLEPESASYFSLALL